MRHNRAHSYLSEGPGLIPQPLAPERRAPIPAVDLRPVRGHSILAMASRRRDRQGPRLIRAPTRREFPKQPPPAMAHGAPSSDRGPTR